MFDSPKAFIDSSLGFFAIIAVGAFCVWLARLATTSRASRERDSQLEVAYAPWIRWSNRAVLLALCLMVPVYVLGWAGRTDWRPFAFCFGLAMFAPGVVMIVAARVKARPVSEPLRAYASDSCAPFFLMPVLPVLGFALLLAGLWGWLCQGG